MSDLPPLYLTNKSQIALRAYGSMPAVGSSKITVREPPINAMATESFLFIPPERDSTLECLFEGNSRSSSILKKMTIRSHEEESKKSRKTVGKKYLKQS